MLQVFVNWFPASGENPNNQFWEGNILFQGYKIIENINFHTPFSIINIKLKVQCHKHYGCTYVFGGWVAYEVPVFTVFLIIIF